MKQLAAILGIPEEKLAELDQQMMQAGFEPAAKKVEDDNQKLIEDILSQVGLESNSSAQEVRTALAGKAEQDDEALYTFLDINREHIDFHKVADAARNIATESEGWFLKKEYGEQILREREPEYILDHLGYKSVDELLEKEDITEIFSALRFTETDEWMHKTFDVAYTKFTADDFEHRPIELKVLGPQWMEMAKKYVAKKHHNVSHLKEFGVIFLNPIAQSGKGKFVRDFALLLHYFHEISFYSKLFQKYAEMPDFNEKFISLLRGDVKEAKEINPGEWLIVQRYLWKLDPKDPRLFIPHVNPESMHWRKAEQDLVTFGEKEANIDLEFWNKLWSVAGFFGDELVSFDLEDNAMMVAHKAEGKDINLTYHQQEALWNKLFAAYVGGYEKLEEHLVQNMQNGVITV